MGAVSFPPKQLRFSYNKIISYKHNVPVPGEAGSSAKGKGVESSTEAGKCLPQLFKSIIRYRLGFR